MIARLSLILPVWASGYVCSITDFMNKFCVQFRNGIQASIIANSAGLPGHSAPVADMPLATLQKPTLLGGVEAACCSRGAQEKKTEGCAVVLVKVSGRANLIWVFSNERTRMDWADLESLHMVANRRRLSCRYCEKFDHGNRPFSLGKCLPGRHSNSGRHASSPA